METIIWILAALLFAFFFLLDTFYQKKVGNYFITRFIAIVAVSIPALFNGMKWGDDKSYFYMTFFSVTLVGYCLFLVLLYFFIIKKYDNDKDLILSAIYNGYKEFKNEIKSLKQKYEREQKQYEKTFLKIHEQLVSDLPQFIVKIYSQMKKDDDFTKYTTFVMEGFISRFFSDSNARFTLRILDIESDKMVAAITTREIKPADIPLNQKNMISESLKKNKPLIYSENAQFHYDTDNSIANGKYDDYVSYCIARSGSKPIMSVNLDVKGEESVNRMKAFVKTSIFKIVCDAIYFYYMNEEEKRCAR